MNELAMFTELRPDDTLTDDVLAELRTELFDGGDRSPATVDTDREVRSDSALLEAPVGAARHRRAPFAAVAAAVLLIATGAVVVTIRARRDHADPTPASTPLTVEETTPATSSTAPGTTAATTSTSPVEPTTTPLTTPAPTTWVDVAAARNAALAGFDSVSFTATVADTYDGRPDMDSHHTNDVTVLNDGTLWATGDTILFNSYDPTTATARVAFVQQDGTTGYQELVGQTDNSVALLTMLGSLDPAGANWAPDSPVTTAVVDGRGVWQVEQTSPVRSRSEHPQIDAWTIDQATGLIIGYQQDGTYDDAGDRSHRTVTLTNVRTGIQLPAEFPGAFPADANVERSGDPNNRAVTLADAAAQFGDGFVVPDPLPPGTAITIESIQTPLDDNDTTPSTIVTFTIPDGFTRSTVMLSKTPIPASGTPDGWIVVGDTICRSADGTSCVEDSAGGTPIGAGAWAGVNASPDGAAITASSNGVRLTVSAGTSQAALAVARSLTIPG